jgi:hypothetical protein
VSLLITAKGITKLSQLQIDADKDWGGKGITNIRQIADGMALGHIIQHNGSILETLVPGTANYVLTSAGAGHRVAWAPGGIYYHRFYPATLSSSVAIGLAAIAQSITKNTSLTLPYKFTYNDDPADLIKRITPTMDSSKSVTTIAASDQSIAKNAFARTDLSIPVDGFVEETAAGVQTDHTSQAKSATANDLNLCPMSDTVLDKIYIGSNFKFYRVWMTYGTAGIGNWTNVCYYWNGAWTVCVGEVDNTSNFLAAAGIRSISQTVQGDWALSNIMGYNLFWMMIRTDNFVNRTTKPLGTQIFVSIK